MKIAYDKKRNLVDFDFQLDVIYTANKTGITVDPSFSDDRAPKLFIHNAVMVGDTGQTLKDKIKTSFRILRIIWKTKRN